MGKISRLISAGYALVFRRSDRSRRPRSVTIGLALGVSGWALPMANAEFFEYMLWSFGLIAYPHSFHARPDSIPPLVQAYFAFVLLVWALFPMFLLFFAAQGRNWAKWSFISYSVFCRSDYFWATYKTLSSHPGIAGFHEAFLEGANPMFTLQAVLLTASIVLLSLPPANRWYRSELEPPDRVGPAITMSRRGRRNVI